MEQIIINTNQGQQIPKINDMQEIGFTPLEKVPTVLSARNAMKETIENIKLLDSLNK